jgi:glycosyltransferase involved in cell wall biosynthesis
MISRDLAPQRIVRCAETAAYPVECQIGTSLKVLVVTAMYPRPGNEDSGAFVMHQVEQLRALGHTVDVLDFRGDRSKLEYLKAAVEVFRRTRHKRYSVVHAHYGLTGLPALFRSSTPLVISLHGSDALVGWHEPLLSRVACKFADATIVASSKIARRIPGDVIPCGVDLAVFEPKPKTEARQRLRLELDRKYVLFPFNPTRSIKRFDLASGAVAKLAGEGVDIELLTVSKIPNREMPWYYSAADVMILCSNSEGSPTAVKEALACNLPVVSTNVGDVTEITQGIAGVQLTEQTAASLAGALKRVLCPPAGFVFNGRTAMERYSQPKMVQAILRVYRRVIERRDRAAARSR